MFAIKITRENVDKIAKLGRLDSRDLDTMRYYAAIGGFYFVDGYYNDRSVYLEWSTLPGYIFTAIFDYDPVKIETDWDQIVRK